MKVKLTGKNRKIIMEAIAFLIVLAVATAAIDIYIIQPNAKQKTSYSTAQVVLDNGQVIQLDSKTNSAKSLSIISETGSGNGISSTVGASISSINTNLYMTPTFSVASGVTVQSYTISGTYSVYLNNYLNGMGTLVWSANVALSPVSPLPTLVSGHSVIISSSTVNTSGTPFSGKAPILTSYKDYELRDDISGATLTITFSDGVTISQLASNAEIAWVFEYVA